MHRREVRKGLLLGVWDWESGFCSRIPSVYTALISHCLPFCLFYFLHLCLSSSVFGDLLSFSSLALPPLISPSLLLPSFLSSFLPSQLSPWSFYSLFPPPSLPSVLPLLPLEVPSPPGAGRRRMCRVKTSLCHRHLTLLGIGCSSCGSFCFQFTSTTSMDCHVGEGTPKDSWETV